jgi:hypothetical protein
MARRRKRVNKEVPLGETTPRLYCFFLFPKLGRRGVEKIHSGTFIPNSKSQKKW